MSTVPTTTITYQDQLQAKADTLTSLLSPFYKQALDVYEGRDNLYDKRVWIVAKGEDDYSILIEFVTDDQDSRIVFSSDEEYAFYLGLSDAGAQTLYGMNLLSKQKYPIGLAQNFNLLSCSGTRNYIVVNEEGEIENYVIYDFGGKKVNSLVGMSDLGAVRETICY